jgi:hypothetical protein
MDVVIPSLCPVHAALYWMQQLCATTRGVHALGRRAAGMDVHVVTTLVNKYSQRRERERLGMPLVMRSPQPL